TKRKFLVFSFNIILTENSLLKTSVIVDIIGALPRVVFVNLFRRALPYANVEAQCIASLLSGR
ncbi:MAG: hypothetical protein LBQ66_04790, partial [Planctomycetaceae bacterium]|nr:hypothetical protein [Planctomycetaceae bacterium]